MKPCKYGLLLLLLGVVKLTVAASTSLGSNNAVRCFEESRFVLSMNGLSSCHDAILRGNLNKRDLAATYSNRGIIYARNGRYSAALKDYTKAIRLIPGLGQAYINRGNAYYHTHEYKKALIDYDLALELDGPAAEITYFNRGLVLFKLERVSEAITSLKQAQALNPDSKKIKRILRSMEKDLSNEH